MLADLSVLLIWWFFIFGIGLIFWPLTKKLFAGFFDQGYLFAKVIGIGLSSYLIWLPASLKILPFFQETIWLVLILGLIFNLFLVKKEKFLTGKTSILLFEEGIFLLALIFWSFIRGLQPDIQGLEKFMDFGFVNSLLRSKYFPPADMWFAGKSINYYYFGHFVTAFLTKLSGIDAAITYNLMIATLFAFTFSLTFSLTGNLIYFFVTKNFKNLRLVFIGGLLSALLISLGANLHPAYYNLKMGLFKKPYCDGSFFYWYPNATRYIGYCPEVEDKTIHEFPSYSFVVSDLHGHVSDIPFVLTFLALTLILLLNRKINLASHFSLSLLLAIFFMTNQWDFPIYLMVLGFSLLAGHFQHFGLSGKTIINSIFSGLLILLPAIVLILPFQLNFEPIVSGIAFVRAQSLPYQLLILWGIPWFFGLSFLTFLFGRQLKSWFKPENFIKRLSEILKVPIQLMQQKEHVTNNQLLITDIFVLILFLTGTILIAIPEVIYVKDIYIPSYHRANTMFKLTYQSFMLFAIAIGYVIIRILSSLQKGFLKISLFAIYYLLFAILMVYPFYAIKGYYGEVKPGNYKGLYGLKFLERLYPGDYQAILWLNQNIKGQPNILEAAGDSYTDYERISMATGLSTIEGWLVHEWLWRGSYDEPGKRNSEVQTVYETNDPAEAKTILEKYKVKYLILGGLERQKYTNINEKKFDLLGETVFENTGTKIYKLF